MLSIAHLYLHDGDRDCVVLSLRGSLDSTTVSELRAAITIEAGRLPRPGSIVVDLTDINHVAPAAVSTLMVGNRLCAVLGVNLAVRGPSPLISNLLSMTFPDQPPRPGRPDAFDRRPRCGPVRRPAPSGIRRRAGPGGITAPPTCPFARTRPGRGR